MDQEAVSQNGQSEWTIESTRLPEFCPPGLEVDHEDTKIEIENPYVINPIEKDDSIDEVDRSWLGGKYFLPNDRTELSRLDRQHIMWTRILDGDLVKGPVTEPKHVLDLGTGSGIWAMDFARQHPGSQVLGIDISKPTPSSEIPQNCRFEERDFMDPWDYPQKFDLVHGRLIFVAQRDPRKLLQQAFESLAPGGYLEHQELYGVPIGLDGSYSGTFMEQFFFDTVVASKKLGNNMLTIQKYKRWMTEIGFEDVVELHRALPLNPWPAGAYKAIGEMQQKNLEVGFGGLYTRMLTKGLGWSPEKTADAIKKALEQVRAKNIHAYFPIFVVYGRKPLNAE